MKRTRLISVTLAATLGVAAIVAGCYKGIPTTQPGTPQASIVVSGVDQYVRAINESATSFEATAAYMRGVAADADNVALHNAYMERMLALRQPDLAVQAAQELTRLDPSNGVAWAVAADKGIREDEFGKALPAALRAANLLRDDQSVQAMTGALLAWYDTAPDRPNLSKADLELLEQARSALRGKKPFEDSYAQVKEGQAEERDAPETAQRGVEKTQVQPQSATDAQTRTAQPAQPGEEDEAGAPTPPQITNINNNVNVSVNYAPTITPTWYPASWSYYPSYCPAYYPVRYRSVPTYCYVVLVLGRHHNNDDGDRNDEDHNRDRHRDHNRLGRDRAPVTVQPVPALTKAIIRNLESAGWRENQPQRPVLSQAPVGAVSASLERAKHRAQAPAPAMQNLVRPPLPGKIDSIAPKAPTTKPSQPILLPKVGPKADGGPAPTPERASHEKHKRNATEGPAAVIGLIKDTHGRALIDGEGNRKRRSSSSAFPRVSIQRHRVDNPPATQMLHGLGMPPRPTSARWAERPLRLDECSLGMGRLRRLGPPSE